MRPVEGLGVSPFAGRRVLVTGHTGFKGSWLAHWLDRQGASVSGLALAPDTTPSLFEALDLARRIDHGLCDLRDQAAVATAVAAARPEIVFHLAAQPLVRRSYRYPIETFATNVLGTAHLLHACYDTPGIRAIVVVTSDKCYAPTDDSPGYRESDPLGGLDPYSASKACQEWVAQSWRASFGRRDDAPLLATARAGNVIGGGDWAEDRLVPDLVRAAAARQSAEIRNPRAIRPWQHVLEPLAGYLDIGARLLAGDMAVAEAWNFGPATDSMRPVADLCTALAPEIGFDWTITGAADQPPETTCLRLNSDKARARLGWVPRWSFTETMQLTGSWYRRHAGGESAAALCDEQLDLYEARHA